MKVLVDLNVLLDVIQRREGLYDGSAAVLSLVAERQLDALVPAHALTTVHYLVESYASREQADEVVDWLLADFEIAAETRDCFVRARSLEMPDFEDAVTAAVAETADCDAIVTRNLPDFARSPVRAVSPEELLVELG